MKTVKALVAFSNGVISMEQYEVRSLPTDMANDLIAAGICVDAAGGSGGGVLVVTATFDEQTGIETLNKTWQEIHDAITNGIVYLYSTDNEKNVGIFIDASFRGREGGNMIYNVRVIGGTSATVANYYYIASSADGYPTLSE